MVTMFASPALYSLHADRDQRRSRERRAVVVEVLVSRPSWSAPPGSRLGAVCAHPQRLQDPLADRFRERSAPRPPRSPGSAADIRCWNRRSGCPGPRPARDPGARGRCTGRRQVAAVAREAGGVGQQMMQGDGRPGSGPGTRAGSSSPAEADRPSLPPELQQSDGGECLGQRAGQETAVRGHRRPARRSATPLVRTANIRPVQHGEHDPRRPLARRCSSIAAGHARRRGSGRVGAGPRHGHRGDRNQRQEEREDHALTVRSQPAKRGHGRSRVTKA